jgi:hypothetical protein
MVSAADPTDLKPRRIHCGRKAAMTTLVLKRKLRNFPAANLSQRIAAAS